jgi:hypothetical protein
MKKELKKTSKHNNYNKKRQPLFRIEIVPSDDTELLQKIKADFIEKSGTPKQAVIDLYEFARQHGYFDK